MVKNTVIFGGAFDPFHNGHLSIIDTLQKHPSVQEIYVIPTYIPPHKQASIAPFEDRLHMLSLALDKHKNIHIQAIEAQLTQPSYTIHTLEALRIQHKKQWGLAMGYDQYNQFHTWKSHETLRKYCNMLYVFHRKSNNTATPIHNNREDSQAHFFDINIPYTSHDIRLAIATINTRPHLAPYLEQCKLDAVLPKIVLDYIRLKGLYL